MSTKNMFFMFVLMHQMIQMFYMAFIFLQMFLSLIVADNINNAFGAIFAVLMLSELDPLITTTFSLVMKNFHPWLYTAPHYMAFPADERDPLIFIVIFSVCMTKTFIFGGLYYSYFRNFSMVIFDLEISKT